MTKKPPNTVNIPTLPSPQMLRDMVEAMEAAKGGLFSGMGAVYRVIVEKAKQNG